MKNTLKHLCTVALSAAKRTALLFQIRSLEILIDGQCQALECVTCPMTSSRIILARTIARAELARVRSEYCAALPVGQRRTWRMV
jgi:hypothetical protein